MAHFSESEIRDQLARNIGLLGQGLKLIAKELFIPNELGTRGFIDLVAKDSKSRYVLIEIKRTDEAAREAIHEIVKYIEGVKTHLGVREDELRVVVIAVEWDELLVPFSAFVAKTTVNAEGFQVILKRRRVAKLTKVDLLAVTDGRLIAPWHELAFYSNHTSFSNGIRTYEASCAHKGIKSYVLVELVPPKSAHKGLPSPKQITMRGAISEMAMHMGVDTAKLTPPLYKYVLYYAMQQLMKSQYLDLLKKANDDYADIKSSIKKMGDEEALLTLHEALNDGEPRPESDFLEIGYPAKFFSRLLEDEGWRVRRIRRYGAFSRNKLLTDRAIISDLSGELGNTGQRYRKEFNTGNKAQLAEVRRGVNECLSSNEAWRRHIHTILDELEAKSEPVDAFISVYNPSHGLLTLYLLARDEERALLYVPTFTIMIEPKSPTQMYFGALMPATGGSADFDVVLKKFYEGDIFQLMYPISWGGYESRDTAIMRQIGWRYRTFRVDVVNEIDRDFFRLTEDGWESCEGLYSHEGLASFMRENDEFILRIVEEYGSRWHGGMISIDR